MHCMANSGKVNGNAFAANYLGKVSCATTGDILVGGTITQIPKYLGFKFNLSKDVVV